jgi:hypothetical protein
MLEGRCGRYKDREYIWDLRMKELERKYKSIGKYGEVNEVNG